MPRIQTVNRDDATGTTAELLDKVKAKMGGVPNLLGTMAQSPAVLGLYLAGSEALGGTKISAGLREQLAVAVAGAAGCGYCASAHTLLGKNAGVPADELEKNLLGESADDRTAAALAFARAIVAKRGWVSDDDLAAVRAAGFDEAEVVEIIAVVAFNTFTNFINHIAETDNDFPVVEVPESATV